MVTNFEIRLKKLSLEMNKTFIALTITLFILVMGLPAFTQTDESDRRDRSGWVDSVLSAMTLDEMIGQLIMVRANNPNEAYFSVIDTYIRDYGIGGVTFFGGKPYRQAVQANAWQKSSKVPLLVSIDAEWGLGMRLDSTVSFPYPMTLGAIRDDSLLVEMGRQVGQQLRRLGIQMNFAPVVDINSNPANPVIHMRSFGEDRTRVTNKGKAYMQGLMQAGVLVTAKHFPGHGDTDTDSHFTLPLIRYGQSRLDSIELYPFRELISAGLTGVMIAHLYIPSLEPAENTPSTLSRAIVTDLLQKELGFQGLIITDALDMKGVTKYYPPGEIEVKALEAGNDILLLSVDVPVAITSIRKAIDQGRISEDVIREKCRKVLTYKLMAGLDRPPDISLEYLDRDLRPVESEVLTRQLFEQAVTLVRNRDDILPLRRLDTLNMASVSIGPGEITAFQERLDYYSEFDHFTLKQDPAPGDISALMSKLTPYNLVIVSIQNTGIRTSNQFNISHSAIEFVKELQFRKKIVLDIFASPYALNLFKGLPGAVAILVSYQDHSLMQDISAQAIFGGIPVTGSLPVTASVEYPAGAGITTSGTRLKYTIPEALGISSYSLEPIHSLVNSCIRNNVFPGCQVFAAKDGQVFFMESYGRTTYNDDQLVNDFSIYDLASLTKAVATTPAVMKLQEEGKIEIDQMLVHYLPFLGGTDKASIIIRDIMTHQARLKPWIPFYTCVIKDNKPDTSVFHTSISEEFPTRVAENMYIKNGYDRVIMDTIIRSKLLKTSEYKYSDLGYYFLKDILQLVTNMDLNDFVMEQFYRPLGLSTMGYLPRERFPVNRIIPTEYDLTFRMQLLQGDVHDQGAAMLGGVAGHAGLFSNANDLGIFTQMLLNEGKYGGNRYLDPETIRQFTQLQNPLNENRRGIGFDKPLIVYEKDGPTCKSASRLSYGHSGFTGTYLWADPANGLVYVFLSNRVHPYARNNKLSELSIRTKIHQYFYDAIKKSEIFAPQN